MIATSYKENTATVTDEMSRERKMTTDGVGRLSEVVEAPGVTNYGFTTTYTYDAIDTLSAVTQGSRLRSFTNSSLGRLVTANQSGERRHPVRL